MGYSSTGCAFKRSDSKNLEAVIGSVTSHRRTIFYPPRNHSGKLPSYRYRIIEPYGSYGTPPSPFERQKSEFLISMGHLEFIRLKKQGKIRGTESGLHLGDAERYSTFIIKKTMCFYFFSFIVKYLYSCISIGKSSVATVPLRKWNLITDYLL